MKLTPPFVSECRYPVTAAMLRAAQDAASRHNEAASESQIKLLLIVGLPRSIRRTPTAALLAHINEQTAATILEAAMAASIAERAWHTKLWQALLCRSALHRPEPALPPSGLRHRRSRRQYAV